MLFTNFIQPNVLLLIQVRISLFRHLVLGHNCRYIGIITQIIKYRQIHTLIFFSPTSGSPLIFNNTSSSFSGKIVIDSSISTSSFSLKCTSEQEPISFFYPYLNMTRNLFFSTTLWTHPTTYFLILLILPSRVIFSNSPTLAFTTDPTPIFVLVCLIIFIPSLALTTGYLMVLLGVVVV